MEAEAKTSINLQLNQGLLERIERIRELLKEATSVDGNFEKKNLDELKGIYLEISNYLDDKYKKLSIFQRILGLIFGPPHSGAIEDFRSKLEPIIDSFKELEQVKINMETISGNMDMIPGDLKIEAETLLKEEKDKAFTRITSIIHFSQQLLTSLEVASPLLSKEETEHGEFIFKNDNGQGNNMLVNFSKYLISIEENQQKREQEEAFLRAIELIVENSAIPMNLKLKVIIPLLKAVNNPNISQEVQQREIKDILGQHKIKIYTIVKSGRNAATRTAGPSIEDVLEGHADYGELEGGMNEWLTGLDPQTLAGDIQLDARFNTVFKAQMAKMDAISPTRDDEEEARRTKAAARDSITRVRDLRYILILYGLYKSKIETWASAATAAPAASAADADADAADADDDDADDAADADAAQNHGVEHFVTEFHDKLTSGDQIESDKAVRHLLYSIGSLRSSEAIHYAPYIVSLLKLAFGYTDNNQNYDNVKKVLNNRKNQMKLPTNPWKQGTKRVREGDGAGAGAGASKSSSSASAASASAANKKKRTNKQDMHQGGGKRKQTAKRKKSRSTKKKSRKKKIKKKRRR